MSIQAINVRNQFRGKIIEIIEGSVVSEVDVQTPAGIVTGSLIAMAYATPLHSHAPSAPTTPPLRPPSTALSPV